MNLPYVKDKGNWGEAVYTRWNSNNKRHEIFCWINIFFSSFQNSRDLTYSTSVLSSIDTGSLRCTRFCWVERSLLLCLLLVVVVLLTDTFLRAFPSLTVRQYSYDEAPIIKYVKSKIALCRLVCLYSFLFKWKCHSFKMCYKR